MAKEETGKTSKKEGGNGGGTLVVIDIAQHVNIFFKASIAILSSASVICGIFPDCWFLSS